MAVVDQPYMATVVFAVWDKFKTLCFRSWTIFGAYSMILVGVLEEFKVIDWTSLLGAQRAGYLLAVVGLLVWALRLRSILFPQQG